MPCDQIEARKRKEFLEAAREVDRQLASGELKLIRAPDGSLTIADFEMLDAAKIGWTDSCLLRRLGATGSLKTRSRIRDARAQLGASIKVHSH